MVYRRRHTCCAAAHKNDGALIQPYSQLIHCIAEHVLHINRILLISRVGKVQLCQETLLAPGLQFFTEIGIMRLIALTEDQPVTGLASRDTGFEVRAQARDTGPIADQYQWSRCGRRMECRIFPNAQRDLIPNAGMLG